MYIFGAYLTVFFVAFSVYTAFFYDLSHHAFRKIHKKLSRFLCNDSAILATQFSGKFFCVYSLEKRIVLLFSYNGCFRSMSR